MVGVGIKGATAGRAGGPFMGSDAWVGHWSSVAGFSAGGDDGRAGAALGRGFGWRA